MTYTNIELCTAILKADASRDVVNILSVAGYWEDSNKWRPFADNENNFGSIGNQQSDAVAALVEKLINSIDARLMGLAGERSVVPESENCPKDMRQAIAYFVEGKSRPFGERDGNIFYWTEQEIRQESEKISLYATGKRASEGFPCLTIADTGEGQTPDRFPETFLSLGKQNKMRIPFVQGKFNMGGTGVFQFCNGEDKNQIQLVLSRRNPALLGPDASIRDAQWGFTVIRRVTRPGMRNPMYEYLAPEKNEVLSFQARSMPIFPSDDKERPIPYAKHAEYGSLIKMFEYNAKSAKTNITFTGSSGDSLKTKIEEALPESALPIQIAECRSHLQGRDRRSFVDELLGAVTQLGNFDADKRSKRLETVNPITGIVTLEGSRLPVRVYVFKENPETDRYNSKGVLFTINGQTHGNLTANFFGRKKVNLSYIRDSLFVVVDCTNMDAEIRVDLFMNSRDRMRNNQYSQELEAQLEKFLGEEPTLLELNRKRHEERIKRSLEDQKPLEDTLRNLVKNNPQLANLLPFGLRIPTNIPGTGTSASGNTKTFTGVKHPTFFRFKGEKDSLNRETPLNQNTRVVFETDVQDDYFSRKSVNGIFAVDVKNQNGANITVDYRVGNLKDGLMTVALEVDDRHVKPGDELTYEFLISDETLLNPFKNELKLKILAKADPHQPGTKGTNSATNKGKGDTGGTKSAGLPDIFAIEEHDWTTEGFNAESALKIKSKPDAQGFDFFYNKDNKFLKHSQSLGKTDAKVLDHQYKIGLMLLSLSIIDAAKKEADEEADRILTEQLDLEALVSEISQAVSPYWLSIVEALGGLDFEESILAD
jgi:hypothetical protein